jgi:hypothetical protein
MNLISLLTAFVPWIAFTLVAEAPLGNPLMSLTLAFVIWKGSAHRLPGKAQLMGTLIWSF